MGGGSIDLVGQDDVGKDRSFDETEGFLARGPVFFEDVGAGDVRGHEVRGELDAAELQVEDAGEGGDE